MSRYLNKSIFTIWILDLYPANACAGHLSTIVIDIHEIMLPLEEM